jgi:hypothetical protein
MKSFKLVFHNFLEHIKFLQKKLPAWYIFQSSGSFLLLFYILESYLQIMSPINALMMLHQ